MPSDMYLLNPEQLPHLQSAWEAVVLRGAEEKPQGLREEIFRSWQRCRSLGLDPHSTTGPPILNAEELADLRAHNLPLLEAAEHTLRIVEIAVRDSGSILTLADRNGYILEVSGGDDIMDSARKSHYLPGSLRSSDYSGTNAIGLSLEQGKPIQLTGPEHYRVSTHSWACASAPILNETGMITGALTLSAPRETNQSYSLAFIITAAAAIESTLRERRLIDEKDRLNTTLTTILDSMPEGVIALNENLDIMHINRTAARMLDLTPETVWGKSLLHFVKPDAQLMLAIDGTQSFANVEAYFQCPTGEKRFLISLDCGALTSTADKKSGGALLRLYESTSISKLARRFGGNYAKYQFSDIVGAKTTQTHQLKLAKLAANLDSRVLITGESGTGKELFAQAIHNASRRREEPFVAISCAAIPHDLIESELFGYMDGAFTGARRDGMMGKFELANKGSIFLDEIDSMPLNLQTKLLRVLQQNAIMRLGGTRTIPLDVRVIAATSTNLLEEVAQSNFRKDLYYRLSVIDIDLLPLRKRLDDLVLLCAHILEKKTRLMNVIIPRVDDDVWNIFHAYSWPGNVRELENVLERALSLAEGRVIQPVHLPVRMLNTAKNTQEITAAPLLPRRKLTSSDIKEAVTQQNGNASRAAEMLGISRSTLYRLLHKA